MWIGHRKEFLGNSLRWPICGGHPGVYMITGESSGKPIEILGRGGGDEGRHPIQGGSGNTPSHLLP